MDAKGSPFPPSSSRSGDPPWRGRAVRRQWTRKPDVTVIQRPQAVESPIEGLGSALSLPRRNQPGDSRAERENDVRELELRRGVRWWTRKGRPLLRHPREAGIPHAGAGQYKPWTRKPNVSVIQRPKAVESPGQGHMPNSRRGRAALSSVILAKRGSPGQGRGGTLSLPCWNQR